MCTIMEEEAMDVIESLKETEGTDALIDKTFNITIFNVLWRIVAGKRFHVRTLS